MTWWQRLLGMTMGGMTGIAVTAVTVICLLRSVHVYVFDMLYPLGLVFGAHLGVRAVENVCCYLQHRLKHTARTVKGLYIACLLLGIAGVNKVCCDLIARQLATPPDTWVSSGTGKMKTNVR